MSFALSPGEWAVEPGDVVTIAQTRGQWRIERIEDGAVRRVEARLLARPSREPVGGSNSAAPIARPAIAASRPLVQILDLPTLDGEAGGARIAAFARPWMPYAALASVEGAQVVLRAMLDRPARLGTLARALGAGPEGRLDRGSTILVDLAGGAASSIARPTLLSGGNLAAVEAANGAWEVLQFETAEEVAPGRFELCGLLRAQGGTEDAMHAGAPAGAAFVLLDEAAVPAGLASSETGQALRWRFTPAGRSLDDDASIEVDATLGLRALRPLSPVHLRARFEPDGALIMTWLRRSRSDADRWEALDVPLGEEVERYVVSIFNEAGRRVEVETDRPQATVGAGDFAAIFGSGSGIIDIEVRQVSLAAGAGTPRGVRVSRET